MRSQDYLTIFGLIFCALGIVLVLYIETLGLILRLHLLLYPKVDAKFIEYHTKEPEE